MCRPENHPGIIQRERERERGTDTQTSEHQRERGGGGEGERVAGAKDVKIKNCVEIVLGKKKYQKQKTLKCRFDAMNLEPVCVCVRVSVCVYVCVCM